VVVGDPEGADEVVQLPDEQLRRPELRAAVGIVGAATVAELVVMDDRTPVGEIGHRQEVVVRPAWPAVQHNEWRRAVAV
jgi:hypothetical protein